MNILFSAGNRGRAQHYTTDQDADDGLSTALEQIDAGDIVPGTGSSALFQSAADFTFQSEGGWNGQKNAFLEAIDDDSGMTRLIDFVHVDVDMRADTDGAVVDVLYSKRGNLVFGDGDDLLSLALATNNKGWSNQFFIEMGAGDDTVLISEGNERSGSEHRTNARVTDGRFTTIDLDLGEGDDTYTNLTQAKSLIDGGQGNDTVTSGGGDDILRGGLGDDVLSAGAGADQLFGGSGNDRLTGGLGADVFSAGEDLDVITDFTDGTDTVLFDASSFTTLAEIQALIASGAILAGRDTAGGLQLVLDAASDGTVTRAITLEGVTRADAGLGEPMAEEDTETTDEDTAVTLAVLANDSGADGDALVVESATDGANGKTIVNPDGTITYTPNANFNGIDQFSYTITDGNGGTDTATATITVNPVNDAPTALDDALFALAGVPNVLDVLGNDSDPDGDALTILSATKLGFGDVVVNADNTITYTAPDGVLGVDLFTYTVSDGNGGTDTASVTVTTNLNEPTPSRDVYRLTEGDVVDVNVLDNDSDPDGDALTVVGFRLGTGTSATTGGLNQPLSPRDGVTVTMAADGTLSIDSSGLETNTFSVADSFTYTVSDGKGGLVSSLIELDILPDNDPAVFGGTRTGSVTEDTTNASDQLVASGQALILSDPDEIDPPFFGLLDFVAETQIGTYGTLSIAADGQWQYIADNAQTAIQAIDAGETLIDSFTVTQAQQAFGGTGQGGDTTTIDITINGVNEIGTSLGETLIGTAAAEALDGLGGNDVINGLRGDDSLTGGSGADTFVFQDGTGTDTVTDFVQGEDLLDVSDFTAFVAQLGSPNAAAALADASTDQAGDRIIALDDDDRIVLQGLAGVTLEASDFGL